MTFEKQKVNIVYQNLLQMVTLVDSKDSYLVCRSSFPSASQSLLRGLSRGLTWGWQARDSLDRAYVVGSAYKRNVPLLVSPLKGGSASSQLPPQLWMHPAWSQT